MLEELWRHLGAGGQARLSLFCSLLQEDSPAWARGRCLGTMEGGRGLQGAPGPSHLGYISGFEGTEGHDLHVFQLLMVPVGHPAQEVQVQRQVDQLLRHREPQRVIPPSPGVPCAL